MIVFELEYPKTTKAQTAFSKRFSLNAYWAGKHWSKRKDDAREWHLLVQHALRQAGIPREPCRKPVSITFYWDDRLDIDNHAAMGKMIVDAMKGWVLVNDSRRYFKAVHHKFWNEKKIRVEVQEERHS